MAVAGWLQAEIGYTCWAPLPGFQLVAGWLQAEIGYTEPPPEPRDPELRVGCRLRSVTLSIRRLPGRLRCGLVAG